MKKGSNIMPVNVIRPPASPAPPDVFINRACISGCTGVLRWIKSDTLPDADETVLIYMPKADDPVGVGFTDGKRWFDYNGALLFWKQEVTHWMPFPEPPRAEPDSAL